MHYQDEHLKVLWERIAFKAFVHAGAGFAAYIMYEMVQGGNLPGFTLSAWVLFGLYCLMTGLGVTVGLHRLVTHNSFVCKNTVLRAVLMGWSAMAGQGPEAAWGAIHFIHHQNSDELGDPHTPLRFYPTVYDGEKGRLVYRTDLPWHSRIWRDAIGLVWAHFGWMMFSFPKSVQQEVDAQKQRFLDTTREGLTPERLRDIRMMRWQDRPKIYLAMLFIPGFLLPGLIVGLIEGSLHGLSAGLLGCGYAILLVGFFRIVFVYHVTAGVNSIGHMMGDGPRYGCGHPYQKTRGRNARNVLTTILSLGERRHGDHHFSPSSAYFHPLFDPGKWFLLLCQKLGLVTDVNAPKKRFCLACKQHVVST